MLNVNVIQKRKEAILIVLDVYFLNLTKGRSGIMGKYGKLMICGIMFCLFVCMGCAELAKVGKAMQTVGNTGQDVGDYVPVYGTAVKVVSGLLALVGAGLYRVASKRGTAIQTLVEAVKFSKENQVPIKTAVKAVSELKGVATYIDKWAQKFDPKKPTMPAG